MSYSEDFYIYPFESPPPPHYNDIFPKDALISTLPPPTAPSFDSESNIKYKYLLQNVIKCRERFINSKNIFKEIIQLNELALEVNKKWNGEIVVSTNDLQSIPIKNIYIQIYLFNIEGGNSNAWGKNNSFLSDQRTLWLKKVEEFKIKYNLRVANRRNAGLALDSNLNRFENQYYIAKEIEESESEYLKSLQELDIFKLNNDL